MPRKPGYCNCIPDRAERERESTRGRQQRLITSRRVQGACMQLQLPLPPRSEWISTACHSWCGGGAALAKKPRLSIRSEAKSEPNQTWLPCPHRHHHLDRPHLGQGKPPPRPRISSARLGAYGPPDVPFLRLRGFECNKDLGRCRPRRACVRRRSSNGVGMRSVRVRPSRRGSCDARARDPIAIDLLAAA